jgi:hypothetical protein
MTNCLVFYPPPSSYAANLLKPDADAKEKARGKHFFKVETSLNEC